MGCNFKVVADDADIAIYKYNGSGCCKSLLAPIYNKKKCSADNSGKYTGKHLSELAGLSRPVPNAHNPEKN